MVQAGSLRHIALPVLFLLFLRPAAEAEAGPEGMAVPIGDSEQPRTCPEIVLSHARSDTRSHEVARSRQWNLPHAA